MKLRIVILTAFLSSLTYAGGFNSNAASGTDLALQFARYAEDGKTEEFFVYCPPQPERPECGVVKTVEGVQVATGRIKRAEAKKVLDKFFQDLPSQDLVKGKEPPALEKNAATAYLWQAKNAGQWSKGTISRTDSRNPASDNGNSRKRMLALHGVQTRLTPLLKSME